MRRGGAAAEATLEKTLNKYYFERQLYREDKSMAGFIVAFLIVVGFFLSTLTPQGGASAPEVPKVDPKQVYIEQKIAECRAKGGEEQLDPIHGYLGCNLPLRR